MKIIFCGMDFLLYICNLNDKNMKIPYIMTITDFEKEVTINETERCFIKQDYPRDIEWVIDEYHEKTDDEGYRIVTIDEVEEVLPFISVKKFWVLVNGNYRVYNVNTKKCTDYKNTIDEYKMVTIKTK